MEFVEDHVRWQWRLDFRFQRVSVREPPIGGARGALANGADSRDENSMPLGFGPMSGGGQQHQYGAAAPGMGMQQHPGPYDDHGRNTNSHTRRSANMTECVNVPSSEHVAEIVGRQV
nr:hypothetical protein BaRGS_018340 [Batillaria attramentaria]